ncbi:hypothetical protein [Cryptosporangium aurantiacum]|uniref:Uncharacterized protein n=1 Tax=Cryptosporangium aurantiacum TaxID=134849 RepID=A0A1M7Q546_9ACTN|nr:hypothetical protein [Cryptosporangium aurantiacum]SHN25273.1 hypothetical protein SAMN05443668_104150 [Cryptosporangium aurantiacum]
MLNPKTVLDRLLRRDAPPVTPPLEAHDRVVAWANTAEAVAVASTQALWLPPKKGTGDGAEWHRLGWAEIHKAVWRDGALVVTPGVEIEPGVVADGPVRRVRLAEPRDLPAEVQTRVTRSVAYTSRHDLGTGGAVLVLARRVPGVDGLTWQLRFDDPADREVPAARAEAEGLLADARASRA